MIYCYNGKGQSPPFVGNRVPSVDGARLWRAFAARAATVVADDFLGHSGAMRIPAILALLCLAACDPGTSFDEVGQAVSPDGRVRAILLETNGGATTSFGYVVRLAPAAPSGSAPVEAGMLYGAVRSECAFGVDMQWVDAATLRLSFQSARQVDVPDRVMVAGRPVRLELRDGIVNPDASCGAMSAGGDM
jgi:hypothetical protein